MQRARMADFLNALGAPNRRLAAVALPAGKRAVLDLNAVGDLVGTGAARPVSDLFSGIVSDIAGKVVTTAVQANLRSAERQQELDRRVLPGIPSSLQLVLSDPDRPWPVRRAGVAPLVADAMAARGADEYAGRIGYWAARAVRALAYGLVFVPLTAVVAAPYNLVGQIWDGVMTPVRWWRCLRGRRGAERGDQGATASARPRRQGWSAFDARRQCARLAGAGRGRRLGNTRPSR